MCRWWRCFLSCETDTRVLWVMTWSPMAWIAFVSAFTQPTWKTTKRRRHMMHLNKTLYPWFWQSEVNNQLRQKTYSSKHIKVNVLKWFCLTERNSLSCEWMRNGHVSMFSTRNWQRFRRSLRSLPHHARSSFPIMPQQKCWFVEYNFSSLDLDRCVDIVRKEFCGILTPRNLFPSHRGRHLLYGAIWILFQKSYRRLRRKREESRGNSLD